MGECDLLEAGYRELLKAVRGAINVTEELMESSNENVRAKAVDQLIELTIMASQIVDILELGEPAPDRNPLSRRLRE